MVLSLAPPPQHHYLIVGCFWKDHCAVSVDCEVYNKTVTTTPILFYVLSCWSSGHALSSYSMFHGVLDVMFCCCFLRTGFLVTYFQRVCPLEHQRYGGPTLGQHLLFVLINCCTYFSKRKSPLEDTNSQWPSWHMWQLVLNKMQADETQQEHTKQ